MVKLQAINHYLLEKQETEHLEAAKKEKKSFYRDPL